MSGQNGIPAGWYPDPSDSQRVRYWDGGNWSRPSRPASPSDREGPEQRTSGMVSRSVEDITKRLAEHFTLTLAVAGSMYVAVRLWTVARFDTSTALAILAKQGTATVVGGTIVYSLSYLPLFLALVLASLLIQSPENKSFYLMLSVGRAVLGSLFLPWPIAALSLLVWAFVLWLSLRAVRNVRGADKNVEKTKASRMGFKVGLMLGFGLWLLSDGTLWLPPENVEVQGCRTAADCLCFE